MIAKQEIRRRIGGMKRLREGEAWKDLRSLRERERDIHRETLEAIARGAKDPEGLAKTALETLALDFSRGGPDLEGPMTFSGSDQLPDSLRPTPPRKRRKRKAS